MSFIGIGPRANRFACRRRSGRPSAGNPSGKRIETFGPAQFLKTLAEPIGCVRSGSPGLRHILRSRSNGTVLAGKISLTRKGGQRSGICPRIRR
jgi:hypothetical protein